MTLAPFPPREAGFTANRGAQWEGQAEEVSRRGAQTQPFSTPNGFRRATGLDSPAPSHACTTSLTSL